MLADFGDFGVGTVAATETSMRLRASIFCLTTILAAGTAARAQSISPEEAHLVDLINAARTSAGLAAVTAAAVGRA